MEGTESTAYTRGVYAVGTNSKNNLDDTRNVHVVLRFSPELQAACALRTQLSHCFIWWRMDDERPSAIRIAPPGEVTTGTATGSDPAPGGSSRPWPVVDNRRPEPEAAASEGPDFESVPAARAAVEPGGPSTFRRAASSDDKGPPPAAFDRDASLDEVELVRPS